MTRKTRDIVCEVMVRLTPEEYGALQAVADPFEARADVLRRCLLQAVSPVDTIIRYRLPDDHPRVHLFPDWRLQGPLPASYALARAAHLERSGFEVQTSQVEPLAPPPAWPDDDEEE